MRIILFGIPEFGTICLNTLLSFKKNVVAVVLPPKSHPACNMMRMVAESFNIPVIEVNKGIRSTRFVEEFRSYKPDIAIIAAYPRLIPKEVYSIPPLGIINCHPSLLPQYRGPNPYFYIIYNGEMEGGVTFHYIDDSFDTGDVIYQYKIDLEPEETLGSYFMKTSLLASKLYITLLDHIESGKVMHRIKQPENAENLKFSPEVKQESSVLKINWKEDCVQVDRLVRASNPFFIAYTFYKTVMLKIFTGTYNENYTPKTNLFPGTIVEVTDEYIAVLTGRGLYYPKIVQFGLFYVCDIREFIKRNNPKVGEILI